MSVAEAGFVFAGSVFTTDGATGQPGPLFVFDKEGNQVVQLTAADKINGPWGMAIDRVPAGQYRVTVSRSGGGNQEYSAVLFETAKAVVTLDVPRVERRGVATPEDYADVLKAGWLIYELRDAAGTVSGYLIAPADAHVVAWRQNAGKGTLVVTVTGIPSVPEAGGGGGM